MNPYSTVKLKKAKSAYELKWLVSLERILASVA